MTLRQKEKTKIIEGFRIHEKDTGSIEVQIGLLTEEINRLTKHLKKHPKDNSSRRGLLKMVGKRKGLLDYLSRENLKSYAKVAKTLGLKK